MLLDADRRRHNEVGEDTWELFESIERSFGVNLGDFYDLAGIRVSELADKISSLADYPTREKCLSLVVFYRLRCAIEAVTGIPARSIHPATSLKQLLPWRSRRTTWRELEKHLHSDLPKLSFPGWLLVLCLMLPLVMLISGRLFLGFATGWVSLIAVSLGLSLPTIIACIPLARSLPLGCETAGELARAVLANNYAEFAGGAAGSSAQDLLSSLQLLVALETGLPATAITPETSIPSGLNIY
jgi:hypothetical protein